MKLQNLIIIFIIIIIPIVFIFSLYLNLETKTISLQTDYDEKLIEATKEAVEAFEINTVEWSDEFSLLANVKRQDLMSSINVFTTGLADKLRIGGSSKESILTYVPAIVFTMYDGYYIYSPTYVPQTITTDTGLQLFYYESSGSEGTKITASATQNIGGINVAGEPIYVAQDGKGITGTYNGSTIIFTTDIEKAEKNYKHVLKTFVPYTTKYNDYTINYTLDNYVRIYGEDVAREGYIIDNFYEGGTCNVTIPVKSTSGIKVDGVEITTETLTENIAVRNNYTDTVEIKNYPYIYNSNNDKRYYDSDVGKFFTVNKSYVKTYLPNTTVGTSLAEYKKVLIRQNINNWEYLELYQLINGNDNNWYYIDSNNSYEIYTEYQPSIGKEKDCSAINYYVENYDFNWWLIDERFDTDKILSEKNEVIIKDTNKNLNLSMSNYSANSNINYELPEISDRDWEQALSNISMITFLQGQKIGLKTYNNYVVVTSTRNNEFVSEDSLYYLDSDDEYYHRYGCSSAQDDIGIGGVYRNTEFKVQKYSYKSGDNDISSYYYKHNKLNASGVDASKLECFDCIVNRNNIAEDGTNYKKPYYIALARERYIQMQKTRLTNTNSIIIETIEPEEPETPDPGETETPTYEALSVTFNKTISGNNRAIALIINGGSGDYSIIWSYKSSTETYFTEDSSAANSLIYTKNKAYSVRYIVKDNVTGEEKLQTILGEIVETSDLTVTVSETSVSNGTKFTFTISGGTSPYKYKIKTIDGLYGSEVSITGNTLTRTVTTGSSLTIIFSDSAGNTVQKTVYGGALSM